MLSRVVETDTEVVIKHYQVVGACVAVIAAWFFVYETFATEGGGVLTLFLATLSLLIAAGLAELRTSRFDRSTQVLEFTKLGTLGSTVTRIPYSDVHGFTLERQGNEKLALEQVTVHTRADGDLGVAAYVVVRNEGGGLDQYLQGWMGQSGWQAKA